MEDICRQQSRHHSRWNLFSNTETYAISIQSCWFHLKGSWAFNTSTPWRKGPHSSSQELSNWPTRGHYYRQPGNQKYMLRFYNLEVTIQGLSKLKLLISHCNCSRFFINCRHLKTNWQPTTLTTQDLDQAQTCCVKMVQQISDSQERKEWMEQQRVAAIISLTTMHPFID